MGQSRPLFVYFCLFYMTHQIQIDKSINGVLWPRTRGSRMEGIDESTELWRHPMVWSLFRIRTRGFKREGSDELACFLVVTKLMKQYLLSFCLYEISSNRAPHNFVSLIFSPNILCKPLFVCFKLNQETNTIHQPPHSNEITVGLSVIYQCLSNIHFLILLPMTKINFSVAGLCHAEITHSAHD